MAGCSKLGDNSNRHWPELPESSGADYGAAGGMAVMGASLAYGFTRARVSVSEGNFALAGGGGIEVVKWAAAGRAGRLPRAKLCQENGFLLPVVAQ